MEKDSKCTTCSMYDKYDVNKMSLDDIIKLPGSFFKSDLMTANLAELYTRYKKKKHLRHKLLVTQTEFNLLKSLCSGKNSGEVFVILDGHRDFPAVIMPANFAIQLLDEIVKGPDESWRYEHAIASFVLDIWNVPSKTIIGCYYQNTGSLVRCPNDIKKLYELWDRLRKNSFPRHDITNTLMLTAPTTDIKIFTKDKLIICKHCCNYNPLLLVDNNYLIPSKCVHCKTPLKKLKKDYIID